MAVDLETLVLPDKRIWAGKRSHPAPITASLVAYKGNGLLSGSFPLSLITQEGNLPSQAEIRILYRPKQGLNDDGYVVATTTCNADGTWQVSDLNENLKFDIVARIPGFNDVIISDVQPTGAPLSAHFANLKEEYNYQEEVEIQVVALGGKPPYTFTAVELPEGLSIDSNTGYITGIMLGTVDLVFEVEVKDSENTVVNVTGSSYAEGDPYWYMVTALLPLRGNALDLSGSTAYTLNSGATLEEDGLYLAGTGTNGIRSNIARYPGHLLIDEDFTIEATIRLDGSTGNQVIVGRARDGDQSYYLYTNGSSLRFWYDYGSRVTISAPFTFQNNVDYHVACVCQEMDLYLFVDGVLIHQGVLQSRQFRNANTPMTIGHITVPGYTYPFKGVIRDVRVTRGVARYTENFTPPTPPFPNYGPEPTIPTFIGQEFGGGYYIGNITIADGGEDDGEYFVIMGGPESQAALHWKNTRTLTPGTDSNTNSMANTLAMQADDPDIHYAGMHCLGYDGGGFDDWCMPARDVLSLAWDNRALLGVLEMEAQFYWSSTQASAANAWPQSFSNGTKVNHHPKNNGYRVRPVRMIRI